MCIELCWYVCVSHACVSLRVCAVTSRSLCARHSSVNAACDVLFVDLSRACGCVEQIQ